MEKKTLLLFTIALVISFTANLYGQVGSQMDSQFDSTKLKASNSLTELSFEELMNIPIVSVSRTKENAFDAPLSSYVITRKEIFNSGALSVPEALRLCPGLFVKQMSNGGYDVTIRGLDNIPSHQYLNVNKLMLVMINNRPIFNYSDGCTYWSNLPIDLIDIERLEIVLGPSAPLYGPNAVTGVINIITKTVVNDDLTVAASVQAGTPGTLISQILLSDKLTGKWSIQGSLNYQRRERATIDYFDPATGKFTTDLSQVTPIFSADYSDPTFRAQAYKKPEVAYEKLGANLDLNYKPSDDVDLHFSGGYNNSLILYGFSYNTGMNYLPNNSLYGMIKGDIKGFSVLGTVLSGTQGTMGDVERYHYDYRNIDAYVDYNFNVTENLTLRPAVHFQQSSADDSPYTADGTGVYNKRVSVHNIAGSVKADYTPGKFRLIGALRADKFKYPSDVYLSYQGAVNYKINDKNIIRAIVARSNSSSFVNDIFINVMVLAFPPNPPSNPFATEVWYRGSKDKALVTNDLYEVGYKTKLLKNLQLDFAFFHQRVKDFSLNVTQAPVVDFPNAKVIITTRIVNLDVSAIQQGATLALQWATTNTNLIVKPFITLQKTKWNDYSPYYDTYEAAQNKDYSTESKSDVDSKATPDAYGGCYINYQFNGKWNFNVNTTYMSKYEMYTYLSTTERPYKEFPESKIGSKFITNAKVSYQLNSRLNLFVNARNAFNADARESFASDKITAMYLGGIHFEL